jgi:hypothetical protein
MSAVLGAHGGAPKTFMRTWRRQMAVSRRGNGRTADASCAHVQVGWRNRDVNARVYAAASNAASGTNGERHQVRASEPPGRGTTPMGRVRMREGVSLQKY